MRIRHALIAVVAAVAVATPANAATVIVATAQASDLNVRIHGTGTARVVSQGPATMTFDVDCQAVAAGRVNATGIGCYIFDPAVRHGYYAPNVFSSGNVATTGEVFYDVPIGTYVLCLGLGYDEIDYPYTRHQWLNSGQGDNCLNVTV